MDCFASLAMTALKFPVFLGCLLGQALRSERRERLEAWAASDSPISHSQYYWTGSVEVAGVAGVGAAAFAFAAGCCRFLSCSFMYSSYCGVPRRGIRRQAAGPLRDEVAGPGRELLVDGPAAAQDKTGQREREERGDMACIGRTVDPWALRKMDMGPHDGPRASQGSFVVDKTICFVHSYK